MKRSPTGQHTVLRKNIQAGSQRGHQQSGHEIMLRNDILESDVNDIIDLAELHPERSTDDSMDLDLASKFAIRSDLWVE